MDLRHEFEVGVPIAEAWNILTDLERIAPCLPGAQLTEVEGDVYRGQVKVKVGPILAQFKGQASFVSRDDASYTATLKGEGRDTGGKGNASALITANLQSVDASRTKCVVTTDLTISGKVAQFGRGALADVSDKLLAQFTENLNALITSAPSEPAPTPTGEQQTSGVRQIEAADVAPLDLLDAAGSTIAKRLVPLVVVLAIVAVVVGVVVF